MSTLPLDTSAMRIVARSAAVTAVAVLAVACAQSEPMAPARSVGLRPAVVVASTAAKSNGPGPQACMPDSKLLGRYAVSTTDEPGTWWRLTKDRFDALGVTDYKAALEGFFGQSFPTLADAIAYLIDGAAAWDTNGNGYVCAFEVNGTRAHLGENAAFLIGIADDKHAED